MKSYLDKFNKLFKGKQSIEIEFFDEEPLSKNMLDIIKVAKYVAVQKVLIKQLKELKMDGNR